MNFAIVGNDAAILPWVREISGGSKHRILYSIGAENLQAELLKIAPTIKIESRWQELLSRPEIEAAIICGADPATLDIAKQLAAARTPLLIFPSSAQGSTWIYELGLIRDETRTPIRPAIIDRISPAVAGIRRAAARGDLGRLLYLQLERRLPLAADASSLLDRESVNDALLNDVDVLRLIGGDYSRVHAVDSGVAGDRISVATVTFSGDGLPEATWSARADAASPAWRLKVVGARGELTADATGIPPRWRSESEDEGDSDPGAYIVDFIDRIERPRDSDEPAPAGWNDLLRAFELLDGTRQSLRRRRAIDLHFESTSERNQFKSQMTAIGCLVLVFTFFAVLFLLLAMPLFDVRSRGQLEAERADAIFRDADFEAGQSTLSPAAKRRLDQVAERAPGEHFPIWIEPGKGGNAMLDGQREVAIDAALSARGTHDARQRIKVEPIVGEWYRAMLRIARIAAFAPLLLFLAAQLMLRLAKPSSETGDSPVN